MFKLITLGLLASSLFGAVTVSNPRLDTGSVSHSDLRILFDVTGPYNAVQYRIVVSPATCTSGTGGYVQVVGTSSTHFQTGMAGVITGLTAATTYGICPEVSDNGGSSFSSGVSIAATTLALPSPHPALPIAPLTFSTEPPNTAGYTNLLVGTDCDIQTCIHTALTGQCTTGYIIKLPVGSTQSPNNILFDQQACDVKHFQPADVSTVTSRIHYVAHGLTEGQTLQFVKVYGSLSSFPASTSCTDGNGNGIGLIDGQSYTANRIDADNFRVYCADKATLMTFTNQGVAQNYFGFAGQPRSGLNWIIIRSAATDAELPPVHVRIGPEWKSKMASLASPVANLGLGHPFLLFGSTDGNEEYMTSNIQIGPGVRLSTVDSTEAHTSSDPLSWSQEVVSGPVTSNIIFRQTFWDFQPTPNRITAGFFWDGYGMGMLDSYLRNMTYFHSMNGTTISKTNSTIAAIGTGLVNGGSGNVSVPNFNATISGSGTGPVFVFLDMLNSNALTYTHPSGVTLSCSPGSCINGGLAGTSNGSCALWDSQNTNTRDGWPVNGQGDPTVLPIGCINVVGSAITTVQTANASTSRYQTEGSNFMIGGRGPGPYMDINTVHECAGLCWHHDENSPFGYQYVRGDYTYNHDTFRTPFKYMFGHPLSDGLRYFFRQPVEWKSGSRINLFGNLFDGSWVEGSGVAGFLTFTSVSGGAITDVDVHDNMFQHGPSVIQGLTQVYGGAPLTRPANRFKFSNNVAWDININGPVAQGGWYWVPQGGAQGPTGFLFEGPQGSEDWSIYHNSFIGGTGRIPSIAWLFGIHTEGVWIKNNFFYLWSDKKGLGSEGGDIPANDCDSLSGGALATCSFTPNSNISSNILMAGDANQAAVQGWWPGGLNYVPSNATDLSLVGWYKYSQSAPNNFRLRNSSDYVSGGAHKGDDGTDMGADLPALDRALGKVAATGISGLTTTAAQVNFLAPDTQSCPVYLATSAWPTDDTGTIPTFTSTSDAGVLAGPRHVSLSGLTTGTTYYAKIMCGVEQPTLNFKTR